MKRVVFIVLAVLMSAASAQMTWTRVTDSAQWSGRWASALQVFHDTMWLIGGDSCLLTLNNVWYSTDGDSWICATVCAPWPPRSGMGSFVHDDRIWLAGGFYRDTVNSCWRGYDDVWWSSDGFNWTEATDSAGWEPRGMLTAVVFHDTMWVIGGCNNTSTGPFYNDVWKSADGDSWVCVTDSAPWMPRGGHAAVVLRDTIWLVCGLIYPNSSDEIWCSADGSSWTLAGHAPWGPRYGHGSVVLRDTVWTMAGYDMGTARFFNDVWYSADGTSWLLAVEHAEWWDRHYPAVVVYNNTIWLMGGTPNYYSGSSDVWNSTGLSGIEEHPTSGTQRVTPSAAIVRGVLFVPLASGVQREASGVLLDISGRRVLDLTPGANDVSRLSPGVYFVRQEAQVQAQAQAIRKVIVTRRRIQ